MAAQDIYDYVVASSGGHVTTIQKADDNSGSNGFTAFVKSDSYAGFTIASGTDDVHIFLEPDTIITSAVTLAGDRVSLHLGTGSDIQGTLTVTGDSCSILCENGCSLDAIDITGSTGTIFDGGGLGTQLSAALTISGSPDTIVKNFSVDSSAFGIEVKSASPRSMIINCKIIDATRGIVVNGGNETDVLVYGNIVLDTSSFDNIAQWGPRGRVIGNDCRSAARRGIYASGTSDDSIIICNIIRDQTASNDAILLDADGENCVICSNRVDDLGTSNGVTDNSGTSTVALNNETAF